MSKINQNLINFENITKIIPNGHYLLRDHVRWVNVNGISKLIKELSSNHIKNIIKLLKRLLLDTSFPAKRTYNFIKFLELELLYRENNDDEVIKEQLIDSDKDLSNYFKF